MWTVSQTLLVDGYSRFYIYYIWFRGKYHNPSWESLRIPINYSEERFHNRFWKVLMYIYIYNYIYMYIISIYIYYSIWNYNFCGRIPSAFSKPRPRKAVAKVVRKSLAHQWPLPATSEWGFLQMGVPNSWIQLDGLWWKILLNPVKMDDLWILVQEKPKCHVFHPSNITVSSFKAMGDLQVWWSPFSGSITHWNVPGSSCLNKNICHWGPSQIWLNPSSNPQKERKVLPEWDKWKTNM